MKRELSGGRGFTLLELMVTILISAILATLAMPSFIKMIERYRANSQGESLLFSWNLARSEARARGGNVTFAPAGTCAANQWECGWVMSVPGEVLQSSGGRSDQTINGTNSSVIVFDRFGIPSENNIEFLVTPKSASAGDYSRSALLCVGGGGVIRKVRKVGAGGVCSTSP